MPLPTQGAELNKLDKLDYHSGDGLVFTKNKSATHNTNSYRPQTVTGQRTQRKNLLGTLNRTSVFYSSTNVHRIPQYKKE